MSEYFKRMKYFDYFLEYLIEGSACTEGPRGLKYYDMLYRAVCLGETQGLDADPGPYYPFVLVAHYFWRRGDICKACVFLEKARGRQPFHYDKDEKTAAALLEAAIREGTEGVRRIKTEDSIWSWASLFKDFLTAELDAGARAAALQRIRPALKEVFEAAEASGDIAEAYSVFQPYLSITPYIYIYYASMELEKQKSPRRGAGDVLRDIIRRIAVR